MSANYGNKEFTQLCEMLHETWEILDARNCELPDDTYLDHIIMGIKNQMTQDSTDETMDQKYIIKFWVESGCKAFVNLVANNKKSQSEKNQNFILKLLKEVAFIHPEITIQICDVAKKLLLLVVDPKSDGVSRKAVPSQTLLELLATLLSGPTVVVADDKGLPVSEKCSRLEDTRTAERSRLASAMGENLALFPAESFDLWKELIKPVISLPMSSLPQSHFWKMSFKKLAKTYAVNYLLCANVAGLQTMILELVHSNERASQTLSNDMLGEILQTVLFHEHLAKVKYVSADSKTTLIQECLEGILQDGMAFDSVGLANQVRILLLLEKHSELQAWVKATAAELEWSNSQSCSRLNTQSYYDSVKIVVDYLESKPPEEGFPNASFLEPCLMKNFKVPMSHDYINTLWLSWQHHL